MLVLSRKVHQEILIGKDISIKVVQVNGETIRIGIVAPKHISIVRPDALNKDPRQQAADEFALTAAR